MLVAVLSLGGIGLAAAVALGFAAKKFAVEVDPRELAILEVLPAPIAEPAAIRAAPAMPRRSPRGGRSQPVHPRRAGRPGEDRPHHGGGGGRADPRWPWCCARATTPGRKAKYRYLGRHRLQRRPEDRRRAQGVSRRLPGPGDLRPGLSFRRHRDHRRRAGGDQPRKVHRLPEMRCGLPAQVIEHDPAQSHRPRAVQQPRQGGARCASTARSAASPARSASRPPPRPTWWRNFWPG